MVLSILCSARQLLRYADVAQLAEQLTCNQQVIGSSPIIGFQISYRRKEYQCADVAQLAEQLTCNQQVIGSSPIIGFFLLWVDSRAAKGGRL